MLFLKPEFQTKQGVILNVVDTGGKAVGYIAYIYKEDKELYIMGQLDEEGEKQNFVDIISPFIDGLKKAVLGDGEKEPNIYIHAGGQLLTLEKAEGSVE